MSVYPASHIKRIRATGAEIESRRAALVQIVSEMQPMTVRQVYYQATVRGIVEKTEAGYNKVQTDLVWLRRANLLPYSYLADSTRWQRRPVTYSSIEAALLETAKFYRKSLWDNAGSYVEIWLEKDALAGVIHPVTSMFDVPLMVARGYSSLSFLHSAAEHIAALKVPAYIYHLGDYDPSGVNAGEKIEQTLHELAPDADIRFERLGVTPKQIEKWKLPSRPTKTTDSRAKKFGLQDSVELDAIPPEQLRAIVETTILRHLPLEEFEILKVAEESERRLLTAWVSEVSA